MHINQIAAAFMVFNAILFGITAFIAYSKNKAKLARCHRTSGEVIDIKVNTTGEGPFKHPVIRYKTTSGEDAIFVSNFGSSNWKINVGDRVEILVDPNSPAKSEIVNFLAQWFLVLTFSAISIGSIIAAPLFFFF